MNKKEIETKLKNCEQIIADISIEINKLKKELSKMDKPGYFEFDVHEAYINEGSGWHGCVIHFAGNNITINEAEEIYNNLGSLIEIARKE